MDIGAAPKLKSDDGADGPWELPDGWRWVALSEVVDIHDHRRRPIKAGDRQARIAGKSSGELFPYYGATGQVGLIDGFLFDFPAILLGEDGAPFLDRRRAKAYAVDGKYWVNNHAHILTPRTSTIGLWLLHSLNFIDYEPHVGGTTRLKLTKADLERIPIPLAPLAEQRRIVERIETLFAEIAEGEAAMAEARYGLDTFSRALLKAAATGELTKDWREANPVTETGHDLLARIAKDRASKGAPTARARRAADARLLDTSVLPQIPAGWAWATTRELADVIGGLTKNPDRQKMPIQMPYLRVANVQMGSLDLSEMKEIGVSNEERQRASLKDGDLLIVEGNGSIDQIGRCAVWNGEIANCVHQNHIIKVRFSHTCHSSWCFTWLLSPYGRKEIEQVAASTSGLHTLSISKIEALPVPLPPPAEAAEILRRASEALAANADTLAMLDAEAADAARLKQSILKAAFEGRLIPQDPTDEPASVLLARIASRENVNPAKRKRGRKTSA
jgi:type I restriction enzyme S subunit